MIPVIEGMTPALGGPEQLVPLWWSRSLGASLGGNGSLGASANLTVAGIGERAGVRFRFVAFLRRAVPMTAMSHPHFHRLPAPLLPELGSRSRRTWFHVFLVGSQRGGH